MPHTQINYPPTRFFYRQLRSLSRYLLFFYAPIQTGATFSDVKTLIFPIFPTLTISNSVPDWLRAEAFRIDFLFVNSCFPDIWPVVFWCCMDVEAENPLLLDIPKLVDLILLQAGYNRIFEFQILKYLKCEKGVIWKRTSKNPPCEISAAIFGPGFFDVLLQIKTKFNFREFIFSL